MTAIAANATNFLINSDYPMDKVVYLLSGSVTMDGSTFFQIPHGLPFTPLIDLTWSYQADFSVSYTNNAGPAPASAPGYIFDLQVAVESDATNLYFSAHGPASAKTVYYRVFGFQPDDSNVSLPSTVSAADTFILNSGSNYAKLLIAGHTAYSSGAVNVVVPHNLGYLPQVQVWQSSIRTAPIAVTGDDMSGSWQVEVTSTSVIISISAFNNFNSGTLYYRVYMDQ